MTRFAQSEEPGRHPPIEGPRAGRIARYRGRPFSTKSSAVLVSVTSMIITDPQNSTLLLWRPLERQHRPEVAQRAQDFLEPMRIQTG